MTKPFAILQPGETLQGSPWWDEQTGEVVAAVKRVDGVVTEERGKLGQPLISYETVIAPDCKFSIGREGDELPDEFKDAETIHITMNSTTGGWKPK